MRTKTTGSIARATILVAFLVFCIVAQPNRPGAQRVPSRVLGEHLVGGGSSSAKGEPKDNASAKKAFRISGDVDGLFPGASVPLTLSIQNLNNFNIDVQSIAVDVSNASGACTASVLTVEPFHGSLIVPKDGVASTNLNVRLDASAPMDCEDATWPLVYTGTAVKP
jgi:hypothetical protein